MSLRLRAGTSMQDAIDRFSKRIAEMEMDLDMLLVKKGWDIRAVEMGDRYRFTRPDGKVFDFSSQKEACSWQVAFERDEMRMRGAK